MSLLNRAVPLVSADSNRRRFKSSRATTLSTPAKYSRSIEALHRDSLNLTPDPKIAFWQIAHAVDEQLLAPPIVRDLLGAPTLPGIAVGVDNRGI